jgi:hypothetical protein
MDLEKLMTGSCDRVRGIYKNEIDKINQSITAFRENFERYVEMSVNRSIQILSPVEIINKEDFSPAKILSIKEIIDAFNVLHIGPKYHKSMESAKNPHLFDHLQKYHDRIRPVGILVVWWKTPYIDGSLSDLIVIASNGDLLTEYVPGYESNLVLPRCMILCLLNSISIPNLAGRYEFYTTGGNEFVRNSNITSGDYGNTFVMDTTFVDERKMSMIFKTVMMRERDLLEENTRLKYRIKLMEDEKSQVHNIV